MRGWGWVGRMRMGERMGIGERMRMGGEDEDG